MPLSVGSRIGAYEITGALGSGGMGEVYRARDTTLHREVALKVLPEAFASDPDRLARFEREAHLLASLNHANIAAIYGLEHGPVAAFAADAASAPKEAGHYVRALVLELVEGPTLADRIVNGPIPLDEALPIARQIADALDAAHEQGVIHRDLKPSNIKVRPDGTVKVLDFGLAKALEPGAASGQLSQSPTITSPAMTRAGMVLGTAAYMSPEQARGRVADTRSDVWAFGCVLFEMLTGGRTFEGDEISDTMAAVLRADPAWSRLPVDTPSSIRRLLRRSLEKDPKRRLAHIRDARLEIDEGLTESPTAVPVPQSRSSNRERIAWGLAILSVVVALSALFVISRQRAQPSMSQASQFSLLPPEGTVLTGATTLAVSREGRLLAFTAASPGGPSRLWVRPIDSLAARPLDGTDWAMSPFWSPDGKSIGFFAEGRLKRVDAAGGTVQSLADVSYPLGGTWNEEGVMLFAPGFGQPIMRIAAGGGTATPVTKVGKDLLEVHASPAFLPDNRHFLFSLSHGPYDHDVSVGSLDNEEPTRLVHSEAGATYVQPGYLLYVLNDRLVAQPFDAAQRTLSGEAVPVHESAVVVGGAPFSSSDTGTLIYRRSTSAQGLVTWVDRSGKGRAAAAPAGVYDAPALSPDGKRLTFARSSPTGQDVWVHELERGITSRLTFQPPLNNVPIWSPDGRTITFATVRSGGLDIYQRPSNGAGTDQELVRLSGQAIVFPSDWSRDGRFLMYYRTNAKTQLDTWILPLDGARQPFPLLESNFNESQGQFSPDGNWIAYVSDESGEPQVYVQSFPKQTARVQISPGGGTQPRWRRDGRELFYVAGDGTLMAVPVRTTGSFEAQAPRPLFTTRLQRTALRQSYDVSADGQRFLLYETAEGAAPTLTVVLNWTALLRK
jgi:serine/threonine protein kinase/Tol biopolymer transport system component